MYEHHCNIDRRYQSIWIKHIIINTLIIDDTTACVRFHAYATCKQCLQTNTINAAAWWFQPELKPTTCCWDAPEVTCCLYDTKQSTKHLCEIPDFLLDMGSIEQHLPPCSHLQMGCCAVNRVVFAKLKCELLRQATGSQKNAWALEDINRIILLLNSFISQTWKRGCIYM